MHKVPSLYTKPDIGKLIGVLISVISVTSGVLLIGISGWFITATALTGIGMLSLLSYNLFLPSAAIRLLALARPFSRYAERLYTHRITLKVINTSRVWLFRKIIVMNKEQMSEYRNAALLDAMVSDTDEMDHFYLGMLVPWISTFCVFLLSTIFFIFVKPVFIILILAVFLLSGILIPFLVLLSATRFDHSKVQLHQALNNNFLSLVNAFSELHFFAQLDQHTKIIKNQNSEELQNVANSKMALAKWTMLQTLVLQVGLVVSLFIISSESESSGPLTVLIIIVLIALFEILQPLPELWHQFSDTLSAGARLSHWEKNLKPQVPIQVYSSFSDTYTVKFSNLKYGYDTDVLVSNLNFKIPANAITAITGANGSGKSTLLDLICGLKAPFEGTILFGGIPLPNLNPEKLIEKIAYMEQKTIVFQGSIYDNIAMGKKGATPSEISSAAVQAGMAKYINEKPNFLNMNVGEYGANISGGQAKMIGFARIILKNAPVVLLDEPTEGLDIETEKKMVEQILLWRKYKTIVLVTHKKSILKIADFQIKLD